MLHVVVDVFDVVLVVVFDLLIRVCLFVCFLVCSISVVDSVGSTPEIATDSSGQCVTFE